MRCSSLAAAAVVAAWMLAGLATAQSAEQQLEVYLGTLAKEDRFTGSALVVRDGAVLLRKGYGLANREHDVPNTPDTRFRIGSITKQFSAAAVLLLQERGKLSVRDPVCKFVDGCPAAWRDVTLHHLLSHTGGIPSFTGFPDYRSTMMIPVTMESLLGRFKDRPLEFVPGEKFAYSNSGYVLLGHVIEKVSGESYESFVNRNIFEPLKLTSTGYDRHERVLHHRAAGYSKRDDGWQNAAPIDMTIPHAAGALYSTVDDLRTWVEAFFSDKLLTAASRELMTTPVKDNYAYGFVVTDERQRKKVSHGGGINGFSTFLVHYPAQHVTVVVLANNDRSRPAPGRIGSDLGAIVFGESYEMPREPTPAAAGRVTPP